MEMKKIGSDIQRWMTSMRMKNNPGCDKFHMTCEKNLKHLNDQS